MNQQFFSKETLEEAQKCVAEHKVLPLCKDIVFKMFLTRNTTESNYCLRKILGAVIGQKVKEATVLNPEILPEFINGKSSRMDINVVMENGNKANIELQCSRKQDDQILRTVYYSGRLLAGCLEEGEVYSQMKAVHQIMIANFTLFDDESKKGMFFHHFTLKNKDNEIATDRFNIYFLELTKLGRIIREKLDDTKSAQSLTELEFWSILLKYNDKKKVFEKLYRARQFEEEIQMANKATTQISQDMIDWAYHLSYDRAEVDYKNELRLGKEAARAEGLSEGKAQGLTEGMAKGLEQGRIEGELKMAEKNAINLIKMNLGTKEQISQATGLPVERIQELLKDSV